MELYIDHLEERYRGLDTSCIEDTYVFILDQNHHLMLQYKSPLGWTLPCCRLSHTCQFDDRRLITSLVRIDMNLIISIIKPIGLGYTSSKSFTTYYLATVDRPMIEQPDFKRCCAFTFSQVCLLPIYETYAPLIEVIYNPYKLNLMLDLDCTLLVSYAYETTSANMNMINRDHYLIRNNCHPDYICPSGRYVWSRPHMHDFLRNVAKLTHVSYWTAASQEIQMEVIHETGLDKYSNQYYFGSSCSKSPNGDIYKSLIDLNQYTYDLNRTIMVDDLDINKIHNDENCLQIKSWNIVHATDYTQLYRFRIDCELIRLLSRIQFLSDQVIHHKESVPKVMKQYFTPITEPNEGRDKHNIPGCHIVVI